jgi:heterogeneous nuclear ribonucleoprotein U-like protein 1
MSFFSLFPSQIAVVVFPMFEELKSRSDKRFKETGKQVPADVVNKMIGILLF